MSFTTKDFIENLEFEYFESYSFQRNGNYDIYENLFEKYSKDNNSLSKEEVRILHNLRNSNLYNLDNNFIFTKNGELNKTAELVFKSLKLPKSNETLIEILKIPFEDYDAWRCWPTYRDAILFFDSNNEIIEGINICFECSNVITTKNKEVLTDRIVYQKLKEFLQSLGHNIQDVRYK